MGYRRKNRRRTKEGEGRKWILPSIIALLSIWLIISANRGKSPMEVLADAYHWIVGTDSPSKSREELRALIDQDQNTIDSLEQVIEELQNKSPYRTAIVRTTSNALNVREEPNLNAKVVIKIPDSSAVKILYFDEEVLVLDGETGKWCKIKYADQEGWVWGNYLELQD